MIWIGRFKETHNKNEYPSIFVAIHENVPENKNIILDYLKHGRDVASSPGYLYDKINGETLLRNPTCYTDGKYYWRSDLIYYYEKYNVELPDDFIKYVLKNSKRV